MITKDGNEEQIIKGQNVDRFLNDPIFKEAIIEVRNDLTKSMIACNPGSDEAIKLHYTINACDYFIGNLQAKIRGGTLAKTFLDKEKENQKYNIYDM